MESSLFFNADTKLQVMADAIDSDAQPSYVENTHLISDLKFGPPCYYLNVIILARMHIQLFLNVKSEP